MQQDRSTINLTVPTGWDQLNDKQLRYVFGLMSQGFSTVQIKTYCLFRWTGMQVMHRYGKGWSRDLLTSAISMQMHLRKNEPADNMPKVLSFAAS